MENTVHPISWNRFKISRFAIVPSLAGQSQKFVWENRKVEVRLPKRPKRPTEHFQDREVIWCDAWKSSSGRPIRFQVGSVDVLVELKKQLRIPAAALGKVDTRLFSPRDRRRLNRLSKEAEEIASRALDAWIRVLRWKSLNHAIGQVEWEGRESGWGTYLLDSASEERFYAASQVIVVFGGGPPLSLRTWRKVSEALNRGDVPPPWFDFLFDGEHAVLAGDLQGGVVRLAVAVESMFRSLFAQRAARPANTEVVRLLNYLSLSHRSWIVGSASDFEVVLGNAR